jgi:hypothetical protein
MSNLQELSPRDERRLERVEQAVSVIPVLAEKVANLSDDVRGMRTALWTVAGSIIVAVLIFAMSVASGLFA